MCWVLVKCGCTVGPAAFSKSLFWDTLYVLVCRHVFNLFSDQLQKLIQNRFAANLRYLELPCDLITREVLQELANRHPSPHPHHWHPNHHHHPHIIHHHRRHIQSTPSKSASCFRHYEAIQLHCKHCQHCHHYVVISIIITQVSKSQYYLQYYHHTGVQISLTYFWISPTEHNSQTSQSLTPSPQRFSICKF